MIPPKIFPPKHRNKAEFYNMDDSEVISSDFPGLRTSAASMTSTASTTSVASMTSTASFHQRTSWTWLLDHPWYQNDQYWSLFEEWIIKNPVFYWYLIPFLLEAVEVNLYCFFEKWLQISNYHNLRHLQNTLFLWNYLSWYLLEPNYFVHFNVRHPVRN